MGAYKRTLRYDTPTERPLETAQARGHKEAHLSVSSTEAKPWALCLTCMRRNEQAEKRKHGITCHTSSPLETGVLQRDSRVWLHPKRRLACPLGRLPMKPNGARRRRRIDVPRRGTPSTQRSVCQLCKKLLHVVIGSEAVGFLPYSYAR